MEREIKYTTDNKKVVVIGSLNSQEKIVQEIFISNGSEIPSGEHFVVKSLHDSPVVSWKESELKKISERYEKERVEYNNLISKQYKEYREKSTEFRAKFSYIAKALKKADESSFNLLCDFICGDIKYIVVDDYSPQLLNFDDFKQTYEDKLRLFSLFGNDDGTFSYRVCEYSDGSGHRNSKFYPFKEKERAEEKFKDLIFSKPINETIIEISSKYNIELDKEKVKEYKQRRRAELQLNLDRANVTVKGIEKQIDQL